MKIHYVYKVIDTKTNQYYIGSRSCEVESAEDDYMGSMCKWKPEDTSRLQKEILKDDFKTRKEAVAFEAKLIERNIDDELNENYHIPPDRFHTAGKKLAKSHKDKIRKSLLGRKYSEDRKNKISKAHRGKTLSDVHIKNMSKSQKERWANADDEYRKWYGKRVSENREYYSGEDHHMYGMTGSLCSASKKVQCIQENCCDGKVFQSLKECGNFHNLTGEAISYYCKGRAKVEKFQFYINDNR